MKAMKNSNCKPFLKDIMYIHTKLKVEVETGQKQRKNTDKSTIIPFDSPITNQAKKGSHIKLIFEL